METFDRRKHWDTIYQTKELKDVSWYQPSPITSLGLIEKSGVTKDARIIDIGGGDSFLADSLLEKGYSDITVLDISETALNRAKQRLGDAASKIKWIAADVAGFTPAEKYDLWHDRAAFHFLTGEADIAAYVKAVTDALKPGGTLIIGTFSTEGPKKCSGIEIRQYSEETLEQVFKNSFRLLECLRVDHPTPSGTLQNFVFCRFTRI